MKKIKNNRLSILKTGVFIIVTTLTISCKSSDDSVEQSEYTSIRPDKKSKTIASQLRERSVGEVEYSPQTEAENQSMSETLLELQSISDFLARMNTNQVTDDEEMAFWKEIEETDRLDQLLRSYEAELTSKDWSTSDQHQLAELYILKLMTESSSPLKGIWATKAEKVWKKILSVDPNNWKAQHQIAFSLGQYPSFLNKTNEAIEAYEQLMQFPESSRNTHQSVRAHLELAQLYKKSGRPSDALQTLENGFFKNPNNKNLENELVTLRSQYEFEDITQSE